MATIDVDKETELAIVRRAYAKQLTAFAGVSNPRIQAAFAHVPRERFLGPGPWLGFSGIGTYVPTPTDDPIYVYSDRLFGLIPQQAVNNGQPSFHVIFLASADVAPGEHVVHVGAGTGYYSAILAHLTGPEGRVTAIELDEILAARATANLAELTEVRVLQGDAFTILFDPTDVIYVNASVNHIPSTWLDRLREGGRLMLPMGSRAAFRTMQPGPLDISQLKRLVSLNAIFRIERRGEEFHVRPAASGAFVPAQGGSGDHEAADAALRAALENGDPKKVTRLYRRDDIPEERVWLKGDGWCLAYS